MSMEYDKHSTEYNRVVWEEKLAKLFTWTKNELYSLICPDAT